MQTREVQASSVPATARQGAEAQSDPRNWTWVEASVWTERMLTALGNGVKGVTRLGQTATSPGSGYSRCMKPASPWRVSPDEETIDRRAVCGRTARTVRREGRAARPFPTPIFLGLRPSWRCFFVSPPVYTCVHDAQGCLSLEPECGLLVQVPRCLVPKIPARCHAWGC